MKYTFNSLATTAVLSMAALLFSSSAYATSEHDDVYTVSRIVQTPNCSMLVEATAVLHYWLDGSYTGATITKKATEIVPAPQIGHVLYISTFGWGAQPLTPYVDRYLFSLLRETATNAVNSGLCDGQGNFPI